MSYDAIVVGGGHNGLTCAAYLGRAGWRVLVVERASTLGGLAAAEEFHPGYAVPGILHDSARLQPCVVAELGLAAQGLGFRPVPPILAPEADGPGLLLARDAAAASAELAARGGDDGTRYGTWRAWLARIGRVLRPLAERPPLALRPQGLGARWRLLGAGLAFRRLGRHDLAELARVAPMCLADCLNELFQDPLLKTLLAAPAVRCTFGGPWSPGTAAGLLLGECLDTGQEVRGGPAAVVRALEGACRAAGVELRSEADVRQVLLHQGSVRGVALADGETLEGPVVVATCDPRHTFLDLIAPGELPEELAHEARNYRGRGLVAKLHLALDGPLEFAGRPGAAVEAASTGADLEDLERAFDAAKYRLASPRPQLELRVPTVGMPELAPEGHHVVSILARCAPHDLEGGWTEQARAGLAESILDELARFAPGLAERIVARQLLAPPDLERRYGLVDGHLHHGEEALDQLMGMRPFASCGRYATPLRGLFLGGSGSHPGGGVSGGPGRLAARTVLRAGALRS